MEAILRFRVVSCHNILFIIRRVRLRVRKREFYFQTSCDRESFLGRKIKVLISIAKVEAYKPFRVKLTGFKLQHVVAFTS